MSEVQRKLGLASLP